MKPDIHPNYHVIKVVMTNGEEYITRSTYGVDGGRCISTSTPTLTRRGLAARSN